MVVALVKKQILRMNFLKWLRPRPVFAPAAPTAFCTLFEWKVADLARLAAIVPAGYQTLEARRAWLIGHVWAAYPRLLAQAQALRTAWRCAGLPQPLTALEAALPPSRIKLIDVRTESIEYEWEFEEPEPAGGQHWQISFSHRLTVNGYHGKASPLTAGLTSPAPLAPDDKPLVVPVADLFERTDALNATFEAASTFEQAALRVQESLFVARLRPHLGALQRRVLALLHVLAREGIVSYFEELTAPGRPEPFELIAVEAADYERELFTLCYSLADSPAHPYENVYLLYRVQVQGLTIVDVKQSFH